MTGAVLVSLKPQKDPASGRTLMVPQEGSEREIQADLVLIAAGFLGAQSYVAEAFGIELDGRNQCSHGEGRIPYQG